MVKDRKAWWNTCRSTPRGAELDQAEQLNNSKITLLFHPSGVDSFSFLKSQSLVVVEPAGGLQLPGGPRVCWLVGFLSTRMGAQRAQEHGCSFCSLPPECSSFISPSLTHSWSVSSPLTLREFCTGFSYLSLGSHYQCEVGLLCSAPTAGSGWCCNLSHVGGNIT